MSTTVHEKHEVGDLKPAVVLSNRRHSRTSRTRSSPAQARTGLPVGRSVTRPPPTPGSRHPADPPSWRMSRSAARAHRWWPPSPPNPSPSPRTHGPSRRDRLPRPTTVDARPHHAPRQPLHLPPMPGRRQVLRPLPRDPHDQTDHPAKPGPTTSPPCVADTTAPNPPGAGDTPARPTATTPGTGRTARRTSSPPAAALTAGTWAAGLPCSGERGEGARRGHDPARVARSRHQESRSGRPS